MSETISISKVSTPNATIHVCTSPDEGEFVNSHVIETHSSLLLIDLPLLKPYGLELSAYLESLHKPISRILITHSHPDHWFCTSYFDKSLIYAFRETIDEIHRMKDIYISFHQQIHKDLMPDEIIVPERYMEEKEVYLDNVKIVINKHRFVEDETLMIVELPEEGVLLGQDLIYNRTYMYVGTKKEDGSLAIDYWIESLRYYQAKHYKIIVPGHGEVADYSIFDECISYLLFNIEVIGKAKDGNDFIAQVQSKYPNYRTPLMLYNSVFMLYGAQGLNLSSQVSA